MSRLCIRLRWAALTRDSAKTSGMGCLGRSELVTMNAGLAESVLARERRCGIYRWATM